MLYLALTAGSARDILWEEVLEFDDKYKIGIKPNIARGTMTWPNKAILKFAGADASEREMKKLLGQKLWDVAIDECGSFTQDMRKLIYQMIMPALTDLQGYITLLGTCETIPKTFFEEVSMGREPGWSVHRWTAHENPHVAVNWAKEIERILKQNPLAENAAWFRTHYLNEWMVEEDLLIIPISKMLWLPNPPVKADGKNDIDTYILGVDLGFNDATSFSLGGYNDRDKRYVQLCADKDTQMDFTDTAKAIANWQRRFPISQIIIDGANRQGVEELRRRHGLPLTAADKKDKADWLRLLRDDIKTGKFQMVENSSNMLVTEWEQLMWKDEYKKEEDPRCQNHLSDATLYAWRHAYHYLSEAEPEKPHQDTQEYMDKYLAEDEQRLQEMLENEGML